jgi:lipoprotein NlpD
VLELPAGTAVAAEAPPAPPPERVYTVRQGDTLYSIAARHGVRVDEIAERNGLRSRHKLSIGQRLRLPAERSALGPREDAAGS